MSRDEPIRSRGAHAPVVEFLGVGVQKAGTTWIHRMLGAHTDVFVAQGDDKDLRFFSSFYDYGYQWYEEYFLEGHSAKIRGEISTSYFYCNEAPQRVYNYNPGMRLVLALRDPVDRVISNHRHEIRVGHLSGDLSLERGIENNPSYIEQSMYFTQLSRWLEYFPLSSFHVVIFEELYVDPASLVRDLYDFLAVNSNFVPDGMDKKINEGRIPRNRLLDQSMQLAAAGLRRAKLGWTVEAVKKIGLKKLIIDGNTQSDEAMVVSKATREKLVDVFKDENRNLSALLDRDLSVWN